MAIQHRNTDLIPLAIALTGAQHSRLEDAARETGIPLQAFTTNILIGAIRSIEDGERRERQLMALLLSGASWKSISTKMNMSVDTLRRAGLVMASRLFVRGAQHV